MYRGGGVEVQQLTTEKAYDYLNTLAAYLRDSGVLPSTQITLGGSVRDARVISHEMHEEDGTDVDISDGCRTTVTFTVQAAGSAPLSYQWYRRGQALAAATGASYTIASTQPADSGSTFYVTVSNVAGTTQSAIATL